MLHLQRGQILLQGSLTQRTCVPMVGEQAWGGAGWPGILPDIPRLAWVFEAAGTWVLSQLRTPALPTSAPGCLICGNILLLPPPPPTKQSC